MRLTPFVRLLLGALALLAVMLALPVTAYADVPVHSTPSLLFSSAQTITILIGLVVPLATYVINRVGPWVSQPVKGAVLVAASALASALYTALDTHILGWNMATLQLLLLSVVSSFVGHKAIWRTTGVAQELTGENVAQINVQKKIKNAQ